jgi:hypothetical protein
VSLSGPKLGRVIQNEFRKLQLSRGGGPVPEDAMRAHLERIGFFSRAEREEAIHLGLTAAFLRATYLLRGVPVPEDFSDDEMKHTDLSTRLDAPTETAVQALVTAGFSPERAPAILEAAREVAARKDDVRPFRPRPAP